MSEEARAALLLLTEKVLKNPPLTDKVEILPTGVGWLRVRSESNLSSAEVTKVNVGEKFLILKEETGWVKIRVDEETEGWVSSDFTKKIQEVQR